MDEKEQVGNAPVPQEMTPVDTSVSQNFDELSNEASVTEPVLEAPQPPASESAKDNDSLIAIAASLSSANVKPNSDSSAPDATPATAMTDAALVDSSTAKNARSVGFVAIVAVLLLAVVFALLLNTHFGRRGNADDIRPPYDNSAVMIREAKDSGNYALFSLSSGKQLSDFIYDEVGEMINGYVYVKLNGEYGILKENGKPSVAFGKYAEIKQYGAAYLAKMQGSSGYSLLDGSGKILAEYPNDPGEIVKTASHDNFYIYQDKNKVCHVNNMRAEELAKINCNDIKDSRFIRDEDPYIYVGKHIYMLDNDSQAIASSFDVPASDYRVDSYSSDKKTVLVFKDDGNYENNKQVLIGDRLYDLGKQDSCYIHEDSKGAMNYETAGFIYCLKPGDYSTIYSILGRDGKFTDMNVASYTTSSVYKTDSEFFEGEWDNYAMLTPDTYALMDRSAKVHFYVNGEEAKTVSSSAKSAITTIGSLSSYALLEFGASDYYPESIKIYDRAGNYRFDISDSCKNSINFTSMDDYIVCTYLPDSVISGIDGDSMNSDTSLIITVGFFRLAVIDDSGKTMMSGLQGYDRIGDNYFGTAAIDPDSLEEYVSRTNGSFDVGKFTSEYAENLEMRKKRYDLIDGSGKTIKTIVDDCELFRQETSTYMSLSKVAFMTCEDDKKAAVFDLQKKNFAKYDGRLVDAVGGKNGKYFVVEQDDHLIYYLADGTKIYTQ